MVTAPKDRGCCLPIRLNSIQTKLNYQNAPTKIFFPVYHAHFLLNKLLLYKKNLHQTAFNNSAILLYACFLQLKINTSLSYGCAVFWVFFQSLCKEQNSNFQTFQYLPPGMSHAPLSPGDNGLTWGRFCRKLGSATLSRSIDSNF